MELEKLNPNMRAMERLESVETRLKQTDQEYEDSKSAAHAAKEAFSNVKQKRYDLFNKAFTHIQEQILHVYKDLTRSEAYPLGGQAYLDIEEDTDMPYLSGIKYHAMPPLKRFRDMEHLSGGEKTMAALALLFAIHSYQPSPFFVLDEVDAALDNANVDKIKKYIREHAGPGMQFIVISLKTGLFQDSESLVGVYRDQEVNSSRTLTLDVSLPVWMPTWPRGACVRLTTVAAEKVHGMTGERRTTTTPSQGQDGKSGGDARIAQGGGDVNVPRGIGANLGSRRGTAFWLYEYSHVDGHELTNGGRVWDAYFTSGSWHQTKVALTAMNDEAVTRAIVVVSGQWTGEGEG